MKREVLVILITAILIIVLASCSPTAAEADKDPGTGSGAGSSSEDEQITINLWHLFVVESDINRVALESYIGEYEAAHSNVKIEQHILEDSSYKDKLLTEFSGSAANIDVFSYWGAGRAGDLVNNDKLLAVEDYLSPDQLALIKQGSDMNFIFDGKLYGLPMASWMMVLYCNTEIFEEFGVDYPKTYDDWLAACKTFSAAGVTPIALGGGVDDAWQAAFVYEALVNHIVGSGDTMQVLNSMSGFSENPGFEKAAELMIEMNAAGAFGRNPLEIDEFTANAQFLTGAAAMRLTGSWFTSDIYTDDDTQVAGKIIAIPIPSVPGGKGLPTDYVGGFIDGFFVNKITQNPETVVDFTFGLSVELATVQHEAGEGFTAFTSPVNESDLSPLGKEVAALANTMEKGVVAWDTFLPGDLAIYHLDATQALLSGNASVQKFMDAYKSVFN